MNSRDIANPKQRGVEWDGAAPAGPVWFVGRCPKEKFASLMYVPVEASRLTFPEGVVLFSLEPVLEGRPNRFGRHPILQSHGIGGSLAGG